MTLPQANPVPVATVVVDRRGEERPVEVRVQAWWLNIAVRAGRTFLQVFLALIGGAQIVPAAIPDSMAGFVLLPFAQQAAVAAQLALLAAVVATLQNLAEILSRLDVGAPELRG